MWTQDKEKTQNADKNWAKIAKSSKVSCRWTLNVFRRHGDEWCLNKLFKLSLQWRQLRFELFQKFHEWVFPNRGEAPEALQNEFMRNTFFCNYNFREFVEFNTLRTIIISSITKSIKPPLTCDGTSVIYLMLLPHCSIWHGIKTSTELTFLLITFTSIIKANKLPDVSWVVLLLQVQNCRWFHRWNEKQSKTCRVHLKEFIY